MLFHLQVGAQLSIDGVIYCIGEHPAAPAIPYGQEGRQAVVYQLVVESGDKKALKVFKPRYRLHTLLSLADRLAPYATLPGLQVCQRVVLTPEEHKELLHQHPDLSYAVLMPWIEGPTWMEVIIEKRAIAAEEGLALARSLAGILAEMEGQGLAHCDLSGPNVILPPEGEQVVLVDLEAMYGPRFSQPEVLPGGSPGYAHKTAPQGLWGAEADRFAGAVLLTEMLCWHDERIREAAWGEQYFAPDEMQQDTERHRLLVEVLRERRGEGIAGLFERAWHSDTLADCATFEEWMTRLHPQEEAIMSEETAQERLARGAVSKGEALLEMGDREKGMAELAEAYRLAPHVVAVTYARALLEEGGRKEEGGDNMAALEYYRQAFQVAPREGPLQQEVEAIVRAIEARIQQAAPGTLSIQRCPRCGREIQPDYLVCPYCAHPLQVAKQTLWQVLSSRKLELLWMLALAPGWMIALLWITPSMDKIDTALVVVLIDAVKWAVAGGVIGLLQYLLLRSKATRSWWWIPISSLAAAVGWDIALVIGRAVGNMLEFFTFFQREDWWSVYWSTALAMALMFNAVFNGLFTTMLSSGATRDREQR